MEQKLYPNVGFTLAKDIRRQNEALKQKMIVQNLEIELSGSSSCFGTFQSTQIFFDYTFQPSKYEMKKCSINV